MKNSQGSPRYLRALRLTSLLLALPPKRALRHISNAHTMMSLGEVEEELDFPLLSSQTSRAEDKPGGQEAEKEAVSTFMEKIVNAQIPSAHESKTTAVVTEVVSEVSSSVRKVGYFQTDTGDFEELLDSSGAESVREQPVLIPADFGITVR